MHFRRAHLHDDIIPVPSLSFPSCVVVLRESLIAQMSSAPATILANSVCCCDTSFPRQVLLPLLLVQTLRPSASVAVVCVLGVPSVTWHGCHVRPWPLGPSHGTIHPVLSGAAGTWAPLGLGGGVARHASRNAPVSASRARDPFPTARPPGRGMAGLCGGAPGTCGLGTGLGT